MRIQVVTLDFDFFNTGSNSGIVTIYDGPDENSPVAATVFGLYSQPPKGFTSTSEYMFVKFTSNATTYFRGFSATYRTTTTSELLAFSFMEYSMNWIFVGYSSDANLHIWPNGLKTSIGQFRYNPRMVGTRRGLNYLQAELFSVIREPLGVKVLCTNWRVYACPIMYKSNMAAVNPEILLRFRAHSKRSCVTPCLQQSKVRFHQI